VRTFYQMRERLDPLTLIESLTAISDEQIARMEQLQQEIEDCTDINRYLVLDRDFHMTSYEACPVAQLHAVTVRMWNSTQHYRRAFVRLVGPDRLAIGNAEHRLIIDAVRRRDPVDAERFLAGHLRRTRIELTANDELFAT
jgi:DNA-binding GntR family transcriptional regulator